MKTRTFWNSKSQAQVTNPQIDAFLTEIFEVFRKHGLSIAHEEGHGSFLIQPDCEMNRNWLANATDETDIDVSAFPDHPFGNI